MQDGVELNGFGFCSYRALRAGVARATGGNGIVLLVSATPLVWGWSAFVFLPLSLAFAIAVCFAAVGGIRDSGSLCLCAGIGDSASRRRRRPHAGGSCISLPHSRAKKSRVIKTRLFRRYGLRRKRN
ncbi:hypothetical protein J8I87_37010 [Paraburkholderia sp. LEh10]|uniref:hypothetical protein n=1 Tax=Paraburkholderia sp. LEh10 TaxID=2821353 RepID=UPI001AEB7F8D|nr:hypothetical protein [Paraburkholderia sp. LEh10]MBP0595163.1 hypothetical protein [Paraburkholderia sp. LEh10]